MVKRLFGVQASEIKEDVIITPFLNLSYFSPRTPAKKTKGFLFEVLNYKHYSVIKTGVGASFVGDAVMYLKETPCKRLYFIGSCASCATYEVGDLVVVEKALALESFSKIAAEQKEYAFVIPKQNASDAFLTLCRLWLAPHVKVATIATLGSLSLQYTLNESLQQQGVGCVDMETSAFFSAANHINRQCLALLYVTDDIRSKPFYRTISSQERSSIKTSRQRAVTLLCEFIKQYNA